MNEHFQAKRVDPQTTNLSVKRKVLSVGCREKRKVEKDSKAKDSICEMQGHDVSCSMDTTTLSWCRGGSLPLGSVIRGARPQ